MTDAPRKRKGRWLWHVAWVLFASVILTLAGVAIFFGSGAGNPLIRRLIIHRLESITGTPVELYSISIRWLSLRVTLKGLVIHGREPAEMEPLFAADEIQAGLRVDSFWGHKISLNEVILRQPRVHIRVDRSGLTNLPPLRAANTKKPLRETLFDLHVGHVQLEDGWVLYNDVRTPLALEGADLHLVMNAGGPVEHPLYLGSLDWKAFSFTARRFLPLPVTVSAKFTLWREGLTIEQALINTALSRLDAHAEMQDFAHPQWTFRYRGWVNLQDLRETFRSQQTPTGYAEVRGEGSFADGQFRNTGSYSGREIALHYSPIFNDSGVSSRGNFRMDNKGIEVSDFLAETFGGAVTGQISIRFDGLAFRADTHLQNIRLAGVLAAIEHRGFPVNELHWDALLSGDTVETWSGPFKHFEISTEMHWDTPDTVTAGHIPVTGDWQFFYRYDRQSVAISHGEFATPVSHGTISGLLDPRASDMDLHFETGSLESYRDFIGAIQSNGPEHASSASVISGSARWDGKIMGPSGGPTFSGHTRGENVRYEEFAFDSIDGDITYSPTEFRIANGHARRGAMDTSIDAAMSLTRWSFLADDTWSADANLSETPLQAVQQLFGWSYPVHGKLTGQFHGRGTRESPTLTGLFDLSDGDVNGISFNRMRGQLNVSPQEARIANTELRLFDVGTETKGGAGIVTGNAGYNFIDHTISLDIVGASLPLANFAKFHSAQPPVGGQISFHMKASGPIAAPQGEGSFRVVDLHVGEAVIGSFDGTLTSDGRTARLKLSSAMSTGEISGEGTLGLQAPYPLDGKVTFQNLDLDPVLLTALHVKISNGHGKADGETSVRGTLQHWQGIEVDARFSRLLFTYQNVQLQNSGPIHFRSSREKLEIDPATFQGPDTNIQIAGKVSFTGARAMTMQLKGDLNLRLLAEFQPGLSAGGPANINASFEGTLDRPRITGRIHIESAFARMVDFTTGLSAIKGDFVFDANRLFFENVTAQVGGGTLSLTGNVNYADRPMRYDITARATSTRIRYPEGMSWLTAGTLRLTGTTSAALLSGHVTVERVTMSQGLEAAGILTSNNQGISGPSNTSAFLRNLQFDIEATSTSDARMQWPGAELQAEANLRVRGTWEHPILLGHIHVLSGDLVFHGQRYKVTRGDINFANPFRLDPVINVEATTTVQQYEITLNFTGQSSKLTLSYRSDPPLPGNDIVTLLALGQTSSEGIVRSGGTGTTQNTNPGASALLSEAVSSQLGGRVEKLFGISSFRVDPGLTSVGAAGAEQNAAARVTVQQRVTQDLTVTYVSNVGSTQEQVIQVEYNVNRTISLVALRDYNGTFSIDIKFKKRFP